ncbi:MAG: Uma2 family endonuclease [Acidobacteria bacterium]|nr:Uma2 family endonuclease [Acidobacteriota bacterium]
MSAATNQFTLADLERMPEDGMHREILHGELIEMPPPTFLHDNIAAQIHRSLNLFLGRGSRGRVYGASTGYKVLRDDRTWLQPGVSFLLMDRVKASLRSDYVDGAPDLAVEVISPSESAQDVEDKIEAYLSGGAHAVVVVYPKKQTVKLFLSEGTSRTLRGGDVLTLPGLLPGWELPVTEIFAA